MPWLIWKEYRANRLVLIVGAVLLTAPYVYLLVLLISGEIGNSMNAAWAERCMGLAVAAVFSTAISQLTLGLLGGNVIAGERADRSAEFLAYLPLARGRALTSKLALVALTAALIWIPNLLVILLASATVPETMRSALRIEPLHSAIFYIAITGAVLFSVAWLLSSVLESPTFSICGGVATPTLVFMAISLSCSVLKVPDMEDVIGPWYAGICLVLAPVCFVAGTWYYLRRVEP